MTSFFMMILIIPIILVIWGILNLIVNISSNIGEKNWENKTCRKCGKQGTIKYKTVPQTGRRLKKGAWENNITTDDDYEEYSYYDSYRRCENCGEIYYKSRSG